MRTRSTAVGVVVALVVVASLHAAEVYNLNRRATWIRKGMTPGQVRDVMEEGPYIGRLFRRDQADVLEWSYPTDRESWLMITFRDGKVVSKANLKLPAFRRQPIDLNAYPEKRSKLGTVHLGMTIQTLDALAVTPESVFTGEQLKTVKEGVADIKGVVEDLFGLSLSTRMGDLEDYDQVRSFDLSGEMFYVAIKGTTVAEMGTFFEPLQEDVERVMIQALAAKKPTTEAMRDVKPGMKEENVILLLGIPKKQKSVRTAEGDITILTHAVSRRELYEIEIRDGVVTRIMSDVRY